MRRIWISCELQVGFTLVRSAASGLVPVPLHGTRTHTRAHRANDEKCMIKFTVKLPPRIKAAARSNTRWPQPASHAAFLNFLTWENTSNALKGEKRISREQHLKQGGSIVKEEGFVSTQQIPRAQKQAVSQKRKKTPLGQIQKQLAQAHPVRSWHCNKESPCHSWECLALLRTKQLVQI